MNSHESIFYKATIMREETHLSIEETELKERAQTNEVSEIEWRDRENGSLREWVRYPTNFTACSNQLFKRNRRQCLWTTALSPASLLRNTVKTVGCEMVLCFSMLLSSHNFVCVYVYRYSLAILYFPSISNHMTGCERASRSMPLSNAVG